MNIAIVEDETKFIHLLEEYLLKYGSEHSVYFEIFKFSDGLDFITNYMPKYDVVFMDIVMRHCNGIETAEKMRLLDKDIELIFVTNMKSMALKGYKYDALNFLTKPLAYSEFAFTMDKVISRQKQKSGKNIFIQSNFGWKRVSVQKITYIEVYVHTISIHTTDEIIEERGNLKNINQFLKVNHLCILTEVLL